VTAVACPKCGRQLEASHIDTRWRGLLPFHKVVGAHTTCPGSETYVAIPEPVDQLGLFS
jgi:hypothetical protein